MSKSPKKSSEFSKGFKQFLVKTGVFVGLFMAFIFPHQWKPQISLYYLTFIYKDLLNSKERFINTRF